jgi:hypothetical protein
VLSSAANLPFPRFLSHALCLPSDFAARASHPQQDSLFALGTAPFHCPVWAQTLTGLPFNTATEASLAASGFSHCAGTTDATGVRPQSHCPAI